MRHAGGAHRLRHPAQAPPAHSLNSSSSPMTFRVDSASTMLTPMPWMPAPPCSQAHAQAG